MKKKQVILLSLILLIVDQLVKIIVKTHMTLDESIPVFGQWFYIRFIENSGAAFGFQFGGEYGKLLLSLFRIVAVGGLVWLIGHLMKIKAPNGVIAGFVLITVGALGNIMDSVFYGVLFSESGYATVATIFPEGGGYAGLLHGKVVDMLYFPIIESTFPSWFPIIGGNDFTFFSPVFNLADSYISLGVIYMILFQWRFFK